MKESQKQTDTLKKRLAELLAWKKKYQLALRQGRYEGKRLTSEDYEILWDELENLEAVIYDAEQELHIAAWREADPVAMAV